ncbi:MAG: tyrosine-type recombinase/integrase [Lachnospiraceae bacterium]
MRWTDTRLFHNFVHIVLCYRPQGKIDEAETVFLPDFSCHFLRHSCATGLCEAGTKIKVIQDMLGHADIEPTMNIYVEATKDLKRNGLFLSFMGIGCIISLTPT